MKNIGDILNQGKEVGYSLIAKGATAFPYSNDLMHIGIIGTLPFLVGKYGAELAGKKFPKLKAHSTAIGLGCSALAELAWQAVAEPGSKYDNPGDKFSDYKGIAETAIGAGVGYIGPKVGRYIISKFKGKQK